MKQYLDLLQDIIDNGYDHSDRTGTGRRSVVSRTLRFDMKEGFPLVTTRKINTTAFIEEMLWFISGSGDNDILNKAGVNIWNNWVPNEDNVAELLKMRYPNLTEEELTEQLTVLRPVFNKVGSIYGPNWRVLPRTNAMMADSHIPLKDIPNSTIVKLKEIYYEKLSKQSIGKVVGEITTLPVKKPDCLFAHSEVTHSIITSSLGTDRLIVSTLGEHVADEDVLKINGAVLDISMGMSVPLLAVLSIKNGISIVTLYKHIDSKWVFDRSEVMDGFTCTSVAMNADGSFITVSGRNETDTESNIIVLTNDLQNVAVVGKHASNDLGKDMVWSNDGMTLLTSTVVDNKPHLMSYRIASTVDEMTSVKPSLLSFGDHDVQLHMGFNCVDGVLSMIVMEDELKLFFFNIIDSEAIFSHSMSLGFLNDVEIHKFSALGNYDHYSLISSPKDTDTTTISVCCMSVDENEEPMPAIDMYVEDIYNKHIDQLNNLVLNLKSNPYSSRHIVSAWIPDNIPDEKISPAENVLLGNGALAPCHCMFQCFVRPGVDGGKDMLSLEIKIRSADVPVGTPYNIAQYALLLEMLARTVDMEANELIVSLGDAHIYLNQLEDVKQQLTRTPKRLSKLVIKDTATNIFDMTASDISITEYEHDELIKYKVSV